MIEKNNGKKIILSLALATLIALVMLYVCFGIYQNVIKPDTSDFVRNGDSVMSLNTALSYNNDGFPTHTITATVTPVTAVNKELRWTLEWVDTDKTVGKDVNTYVDFALAVEGQTDNVILTCKKSFSGLGNVKVICSTVDGGKTASTLVKYVGRPTALKFGFEEAGYEKAISSVFGDYYKVYPTSKNEVLFTLDNIFNDVGSVYKVYPRCDVKGFGTVKINTAGGVITVETAPLSDYATDNNFSAYGNFMRLNTLADDDHFATGFVFTFTDFFDSYLKKSSNEKIPSLLPVAYFTEDAYLELTVYCYDSRISEIDDTNIKDRSIFSKSVKIVALPSPTSVSNDNSVVEF